MKKSFVLATLSFILAFSSQASMCRAEPTPNTQENPKKIEISSALYETRILALALKVIQSDFEPDHVVCIGRGGMTPGEGLSRILKKPCATIMASFYGGDEENQRTSLKIAEHVSSVKKIGGKILLIDDLVDSGKTLKDIKKLIENNPEVTEVKTGVVFQKSSSQFAPDFYGELIGDEWLYLPNEIYDRCNGLSKESIKDLEESQLLNFAEAAFKSLRLPGPTEL